MLGAAQDGAHSRQQQRVSAKLEEAYNITVKQTRSQAVKEIRAEAVAALCTGEDGAPDELRARPAGRPSSPPGR